MPDQFSEPASFRDPHGYVFYEGKQVYRAVNRTGKTNYQRLMSSGFYDDAVNSRLLISHVEVQRFSEDDPYLVIKPETIDFISYPYEWSFSQLKDAALLTISLQRKALDHGLSLRDATAYNVQFNKGSPVFIDTLSFEPYQVGLPWVGYRQFCRHFLCPLALMVYSHPELLDLLMASLDGLAVELASRLLPWRTWFKPPLLTHIHLHSHLPRRRQALTSKARPKISENAMRGLIDSLEKAISNLSWTPPKSHWDSYYSDNTYSEQALASKKALVSKFLEFVSPETVWDLGANTGLFSRLASDKQITTIALDNDSNAVNRNYLQVREKSEKYILPLVVDITNPSPGLGWNNSERKSLTARGPADLLMALALIHHLAIGNNLPLKNIAETFSRLGRHLIIEFVPKGDPQVQLLLSTREDIFSAYNIDDFEKVFSEYFFIETKISLPGSLRTIFLMRSIAYVKQ